MKIVRRLTQAALFGAAAYCFIKAADTYSRIEPDVVAVVPTMDIPVDDVEVVVQNMNSSRRN